jgi:ASC-1-like (ASCH) protein
MNTRLQQVRRYRILRDFLLIEWVKNCLPWVKSIDEAESIYNNLPNYREKIRKTGIIAFKF